MKQIQAEGTSYIYFTKAEGIPEASVMSCKVEGIADLEALESLLKSNMDDMRFVLSKLLRPDILYFYVLHWDDDTDLNKLDERVLENSFTDEDFTNSVKTQLGRTKCFNCNWVGYTLVMRPAESYIGAPGLEQNKLALRYARHGFKNCPNCGGSLRQDVVKILKP